MTCEATKTCDTLIANNSYAWLWCDGLAYTEEGFSVNANSQVHVIFVKTTS